MKVSIVIRAYNSEKTIKKAVNSALSQDFPKKELEVIVINDGSTDKTLKILKDYKKKIRLISQKNQGAIPAANRGFMAARGEYIILLDSDDFFKPTILKEMVAVLDKNPNIDFVYCDYYEKSPRGNIKIISTKNIFNTIAGGIIFKRRKLAKEGFYNERIKFVEYDLLLKTQNKWQGCHISRPLFYYVRRKESIASNRKWLKKALAELKKLHPQKIKEIKKIRKY